MGGVLALTKRGHAQIASAIALLALSCARGDFAQELQHALSASKVAGLAVRRRELHGGPGGGGLQGGPKGPPGGGPDDGMENPFYPYYYYPGGGAVVGSGYVPVTNNNDNNGNTGSQGSSAAAASPNQAPAPALVQAGSAPNQAPQITAAAASCDINGPNCCADNGLNSRLVPVTTNATLAALSTLYFSTVPAGGGFIATPVKASGGLAAGGQIRVNQSLAGAPQAFTNATINLNRPAASQGPTYTFVAGSQICIPNFYSASASARTAADAPASAAAGATPASADSAAAAAPAATSTPASVAGATPIAAAGG